MDNEQFKILCGKMDAILIALALNEDKRESQVLILKRGGLSKAEILKIIGVSEITKRTRKHKESKKSKVKKGWWGG